MDQSGRALGRTAHSGAFALRIALLSCGALGLLLGSPLTAASQDATMLTVDETEELVRMRHYEGMPEEDLERIAGDGCARLIEMLADPEEADAHGRVLLGLARCADSGGYEAIMSWVDQPRTGELDRATFRAWQMVSFALARLAEDDERAIDRLAERLDASASPEWTFRHHRGARLLRQKRRAAADGLAETGDARASAALERAGRRSSDAAFREHLDAARDRHAERAERRRERRARRERGQGGTQR